MATRIGLVIAGGLLAAMPGAWIPGAGLPGIGPAKAWERPAPQGQPPRGYLAPPGQGYLMPPAGSYNPNAPVPRHAPFPGHPPHGRLPPGYLPYGYVPYGYAPFGYAPQGHVPYGYAPYGRPPYGGVFIQRLPPAPRPQAAPRPPDPRGIPALPPLR